MALGIKNLIKNLENYNRQSNTGPGLLDEDKLSNYERQQHNLKVIDRQIKKWESKLNTATSKEAKNESIEKLKNLRRRRDEIFYNTTDSESIKGQKENQQLIKQEGANYFTGGNQLIKEDNNQVVEAQTGEKDSQYQMPDFTALFTQAIENPYLDDQSLYKLTEGKNLFENLGQFDTQLSFTNVAKMDSIEGLDPQINFDESQYPFSFTGKTDTGITDTGDTNTVGTNTGDADTGILVENNEQQAEINNQQKAEINNQTNEQNTSVKNETEIQQTPTWDKGQIWSRGSGTSLRDANAATLKIMKDQGYDLRGFGQFDQANIARDWRLGRFNNMDKNLFYQSNQGHKIIRKR